MDIILLFLFLAVPFFAWFGSLALAAVTSPLNRTEIESNIGEMLLP